jgi:hypothetical protein
LEGGADRAQCAKHAVMGLLRTTRKILWERDHVSVDCVERTNDADELQDPD